MTGQNLEDRLGEWNDWSKFKDDFHSQKKGPYDYDTRLKVGIKCNKRDPVQYPNPYFLIGQSGDIVQKAIKKEVKRNEDYILDYADTDQNLKYMLNRLGNENVEKLYSQIFSIKPRKTASGECNQIADLYAEWGHMQSLMGEEGKDPKIGEMRNLLLSQIKDKYDLDFFRGYFSIKENVLTMFKHRLNLKANEFQSKFMDGKGLDKGKIISYLGHNIQKLKQEERYETDDEKKDDLKDEKEGIYLNLAKSLYDTIK